MADYQQNFFNALQNGFQFGQQIKQVRDQNAFAKLASEGYGASPQDRPGIIQQAVAVNPEAGFAMEQNLGQSEDRRTRTMVNMAKMLTNAPEAARPGLYQQMYPTLGRLGMTDMPAAYDEASAPTIMGAANSIVKSLGNIDGSQKMFSQKILANGNIANTMADGTVVDTGIKADRQAWFRDVAGVEPGVVDKSGNVTPLTNAGDPAAPPSPAPTYAPPRAGEVSDADPVAARLQAFSEQLRAMDLPPEQQQILMTAFEQQQDVVPTPAPPETAAPQPPTQAPSTGGSTGPAATRPVPGPGIPSGYRQRADGTGLEVIPGGPAEIANKARDDAAAARKAAEDAKAEQKRQASTARQLEATSAADQLITAIDTLTKHEGFADLGTTWGDAKLATPFVRNAAKDADSQLKNVAGQVALTTMARLKALSNTGATGFGSLTAPELKLLENSIATLQSDSISNAQLKSSLKIIRDTLERTKAWQPSAASETTQSGVDSNGGGYQVGQIIEASGKRYRVTGGDPNDPDVEEVQ